MSKTDYFLSIALEVSKRGTCLRRNYGAVIVKDDRIASTGYVGAPRGRRNCSDSGLCIREKQNVPSGQRYELCRSVHAEMNAIINASKEEMLGAVIYLNGFDTRTGLVVTGVVPCEMCKRVIINSGIKSVVTPDGLYRVDTWILDENRDLYAVG